MKSLVELFIRLPEDISRGILTSWLYGEVIARVDIAFSSKAYRPEFLAILQGSTVECETAPAGQHCEEYILWALQRFARISVLQIPSTPPHSLFEYRIAPFLSHGVVFPIKFSHSY